MEEKGCNKGGGEAGQEEKNEGTGLPTAKEGVGRNIGDEEKGKGEGEKNAKPPLGRLPGKSGDLKYAVVTQQDRFRLDDPEGEGDEGEKEGVVGEKSGQEQEKIKEERGEGGGDVEIVERGGNDDGGDEGVGQRADFQMGGADEKLGRGGLEENKVEFSLPNEFGEFHKAGHKKSGEDLLDELIRCDENDHLGAAPAGNGVDVLIHDTHKGELENEPGQLHDDPDQKIRPEGELPRGGLADLEEPEAEELRRGGHATPRRRCIFSGRPARGFWPTGDHRLPIERKAEA